MDIEICKYINKSYYEIDIQNCRIGDILKFEDKSTNKFIANSDGGFISICTSSAILNEDKSWTIQSKPYVIEEEIING